MNKRKRLKEKISQWKLEILSGRNDGWVTEYFRKKIEAVKKQCTSD